MMEENENDTVDMGLDDKMSVEVSELPSSLPAKPAITSSSAASKADEIFMSLVGVKDIKTVRCRLVDEIIHSPVL